MKTLIAAAALVSAFASQALAQADANMMVRPVVAPTASHAPAALRSNARATAPIGGVVMQDGSIANDPDPNIRFQLNRESEEGVW